MKINSLHYIYTHITPRNIQITYHIDIMLYVINITEFIYAVVYNYDELIILYDCENNICASVKFDFIFNATMTKLLLNVHIIVNLLIPIQ